MPRPRADRPDRVEPARELGSVYTPPDIACRIVRGCLDRALALPGTAGRALRILDPACGDGAFLVAAWDELVRRAGSDATTAAGRLALVRDSLFGVDLDPQALAAARARLRDCLQPTDELAADAEQVLAANLRCGDALTGPDWSRRPPRGELFALEPVRGPDAGVDWSAAFPAAARAGGFDVIVGNPPYVRERHAKPLFDRLAASELGQQWREARMDLWFYFLHRSLDLLRTGGVLGFIVNSYWLASRGARRLIDRLERETCFEEIQLFHAARIFPGVSGRHMTFRLRKQTADAATEPCLVLATADPQGESYRLPQAELFQRGRIVVAPPVADPAWSAPGTPLNQVFETRQGIAENPPCVTRRQCAEFPGRYTAGEGVFVLTADEVAACGFSEDEGRLLRPYYDTRALGRYRIAAGPTHQLLYLTRQTAPSLDEWPALRRHLERFRPILERRREVGLGRCAWWHLHWPREEHLFLGPKVCSVQMGPRPQFVVCPQPAFVGFSVNLLVARDAAGLSLEAAAGILNSDLAQEWFQRHAKRRGVHLEINLHVLREFPLPARMPAVEAELAGLVRQRQAVSELPQATALDAEIEARVRALYAG